MKEKELPYLLRRSTSAKDVIRAIMKPFFDHARMNALEVDEFMDTLYHRHVVEDHAYGDDAYGIPLMDWMREKVLPHKIAVYDAGMEMLGIPAIAEKIRRKEDFIWNLKAHDMSKLCFTELYGYYLKFHPQPFGYMPPSPEQREMAWDEAWNHHQKHNAHHPEHWICLEKNGEPKALEIPEIFVFEMVADWLGASRSYGGYLSDWVPKNIGRFMMHPNTLQLTKAILVNMGIEWDGNTHETCGWPEMDSSGWQVALVIGGK